jgi:hypothetical protein
MLQRGTLARWVQSSWRGVGAALRARTPPLLAAFIRFIGRGAKRESKEAPRADTARALL